MQFRKVNNLTGWAVFFVAFITYFLTREARGSFWDTGEFIATAKNVGLPHPPGAPLFVLLGRFFIILFGDNGQTAANAVNFMSALASAATILFLFWTITHFARKMFVTVGEQLSNDQTFTVMAAGVVGGLAYTFSDSFWFSAVEGEVYALSSFFTALVFWAMLKWEHADEHAGNDAQARIRSDRWIIFLFFMMGLSIGVHLLNLLTIPAIVMIYYYRRYKPSTSGAIIAFIMGCIITGVVQAGVIQFSMKAAGQFDVFFVNSFGMPFFSGFALYFIALAALIVWALRFSEKNITKTKLIIWFGLFLFLSALPFVIVPGDGLQILPTLLVLGAAAAIGYLLKPAALKILKLSLWCYAFIMLGYFMYFTALIRSNGNPAIDMNNVDNPISLVYYLSREQYGEAPLVYGPHFLADVKRKESADGYLVPVTKEGEMRYIKGDKKYIEIGKKWEYEYDSKDKQLFPRVWDSSNDQNHYDTYIQWLGLNTIQAPELCMVVNASAEQGIVQIQNQAGKTENINIPDNYSIRVRRGQTLSPRDQIAVEVPSYAKNLEWFFSYQMSFMYWRYFMWNFAGKQNDVQGFGNRRDANWISGISFLDNARLGDQSKMPDSLKENKAHNSLYLLPFILGILGCVYQFIKTRKDWIVSFLLFFFTGIAVVLYLNQPGSQPRERDYAYVGSFYAFAIWIGLSVVALVRLAREKEDKLTFQNSLIFGSVLTFAIVAMSTFNESSVSSLMINAVGAAALFAGFTAGVTYLIRAVSSAGTNVKMLNIAATAICLIAPIMMAQQEWDDHDRSKKTLAPDIAKDYLESCAPNAILFTFGDNDTYPLWYAQEVEGVRPDIRIINNSLLGIDWYINQLRNKINEADSVNVLWSPEQIEAGNREIVYYQPNESVPDAGNYTLTELMNYIGTKKEDEKTKRDVGPETFPIKKVRIPVDIDVVRKNGTVSAADSVLSELRIDIPKNNMRKNDLIMLNIIATNAWKRPIYFTSPIGELGFGDYLRKDGLSYRLVPVAPKYPQQYWVVNQKLREVGLGGSLIRDNNLDSIYTKLLTKYEFGGANKKGVYFDEENRRHLLNIRSLFGEAAGNLADAGRKDDAGRLLDKIEKGIDPSNLPYAMTSRYNNHNQTSVLYLEACYKAGKTDLAEKLRKAIRKDLDQQRAYYIALNGGKQPILTQAGYDDNDPLFKTLITEYQINEALAEVLNAVEAKYAPKVAPATKSELPGQTIITPGKDSAIRDSNR